MYWDDSIDEENVHETSLSDEYTHFACKRNKDIWPDQNKYIGKPRYFDMSFDAIKKYSFSKDNIDMFCKEHPECYGEKYWIVNLAFYDCDTKPYPPMHIQYTPQKPQ